jgi:hypothetical protein
MYNIYFFSYILCIAEYDVILMIVTVVFYQPIMLLGGVQNDV